MTGFGPTVASFPDAGHDHRRCVEEALVAAEKLCRRRGARLTPLRRRVLALVWTSHAPAGAYDVLERLSAEQGRVAPPTVYRALDFLLGHGLVHRIESLNAYIGCPQPGDHYAGQFLICRACGAAAELHDPRIDGAIARGAGELGFSVDRQTVELQGRCPLCRPAAEEASDGR